MKKIIFAIVCAVCAVLLIIGLVLSPKPPELSEVEDRLKELIEASYGVNDILFGEGLDVYEKVYEKKFKAYRDQSDNIYYYYEVEDGIYGYRDTELRYFIKSSEKKSDEDHIYKDPDGNYYYEITYNGMEKDKEVSSYKDTQSGKTYYFYKISDDTYGTVYEYRQQTVKYIKEYFSPDPSKLLVYADEQNGVYYYSEDYEEETYDFYYSETDPEGYSYVKLDSEFVSESQIKDYAETVYSKEYLKGVYEMLFTGAVISDYESGKLGARYYNYEDDDGTIWLMESDDYKSLIKGKRIYDFSTAKVVRPGNSKFVNIRIESYLEESPEKRDTVVLSMVMQKDGKWYLDSATY